MSKLVKLSAVSLALVAATAMSLGTTASAQERGRTVKVQGSGGKSVTAKTNRGVQNRSYYKSKSVETGSGKSASKYKQAGCENGVCQKTKQVSGPNGGSAGSETNRYFDENGNYVKDKSYTGVNGNTASKNVTRDGEGEKTVSKTGPEGKTKTRTRWITVD